MPFLLLLSFLFMLFASPSLLFPALDALRPTQLAAIGAMALLIVQKMLYPTPWRIAWPDSYLMPWLIAGAAFSITGALWPRLAVETTLDMVKIGIIYYLVLNCVDSEARLSWVVTVLIVGGTVPAAGTIQNYLTGDVIDGRAGWIGTYSNPNDLAYTLVILVPLVWQMIPHAPMVLKPALLGILGLYFAAIFVTRSRGGMIGAFAVLVLLGFRQRGMAGKIVTAAIVIALIVGASLYWTRDVGFQDLDNDFTLNQRMETIRAGLLMFIDNPIAGVGAGNSVLAWPLYAPPNLAFRESLMIHNTPIQSLAEIGLLGFIPLFLLIACAWNRSRETIRSTEYGSFAWSNAVALEASLIGYVICSLSGPYLTSWFPYIIVGLISAVAMISRDEERKVVIITRDDVRGMDASVV